LFVRVSCGNNVAVPRSALPREASTIQRVLSDHLRGRCIASFVKFCQGKIFGAVWLCAAANSAIQVSTPPCAWGEGAPISRLGDCTGIKR